MLIGAVTPLSYDAGFDIGLKGFVAAIMGGLASFPLAAAGAVLVGVLELLGSFWASAYREVIVFTLLIPVLVWLSLRGGAARSARDLKRVKAASRCCLPHWRSCWRRCCCRRFTSLGSAISGWRQWWRLDFVLLTGIGGQTSFGQASFVGLAAYATTLLTKFAGLPPIVGLLVGLIVTGGVAWLLGLITARLSGHFLALVSVAWGIAFFSLFGTLPLLHGFNGIGDIPPLTLGPLSAAGTARQSGGHSGRSGDRHGDVGESARQPHGPRDPHAEWSAADGREHGDRHGPAQPARVRHRRRCTPASRGFCSRIFSASSARRRSAWAPASTTCSWSSSAARNRLWGAPLGAALVVVLRDQFNDWIPR